MRRTETGWVLLGALLISVLLLSFGAAVHAAKIAIVNPDSFRIQKFGALRGECNGLLKYYSLAYGTVKDRPCEDIANHNCWTGVGIQPDFIGSILTGAGYTVDYYTSDTFPNVTKADYDLVVVQDPLTQYGHEYPKSVENSLPDLLGSVTSPVFIEHLKNYFASGGTVLLVGDAVRLLENSTNPQGQTLGFGKTIVTKEAANTLSHPSDCVPQKWLFERGNPFCCHDRSASGIYKVERGVLPGAESGVKLADLKIDDPCDLPEALTWSETLYYPSDGISLLDVRVQGSGKYVLSGSTCSPPEYTVTVDDVLPNFMGYTTYQGRKIYYLASDSYFDYQFRHHWPGSWHCPGQYMTMSYSTTPAGKSFIVELVKYALGQNEVQTIKFQGTAVEYHEGSMPGAPSYWTVRVNKLISGPQPCSSPLEVITYQAINVPWGFRDPNIQPNDKVEVFGEYREQAGQCDVTLGGSESYYIRKIGGTAEKYSLCVSALDSYEHGLDINIQVNPIPTGSPGNVKTEWCGKYPSGSSVTLTAPLSITVSDKQYSFDYWETFYPDQRGPKGQNNIVVSINNDIHAVAWYRSATGNLIADFTWAPSNPEVNQDIHFQDNSKDPNGTIVSWDWDFGDVTTSSDQNPTHSYVSVGTYHVCLTVVDDLGKKDTVCKDIAISKPSKARLYLYAQDEESLTAMNVDIQVNPLPSGNSGAVTTHWEGDYAVGTTVRLTAPQTVTWNNKEYMFVKWSTHDGAKREFSEKTITLTLNENTDATAWYKASEKVILPVPYYSQYHTEWCFLTSLSMLLRYYGFEAGDKPWKVASSKVLDKKHDERTWLVTGLNLREKLRNKIGVNVQVKKWHIAEHLTSYIEGQLNKGHAVLLAAGSPVDHAIVVVGFDRDNFYINDPSGTFLDHINCLRAGKKSGCKLPSSQKTYRYNYESKKGLIAAPVSKKDFFMPIDWHTWTRGVYTVTVTDSSLLNPQWSIFPLKEHQTFLKVSSQGGELCWKLDGKGHQYGYYWDWDTVGGGTSAGRDQNIGEYVTTTGEVEPFFFNILVVDATRKPEEVTLSLEIKDSTGNVVYPENGASCSKSITFSDGDQSKEVRITKNGCGFIKLTDFPPGEYDVVYTLSDGKETLDTMSFKFILSSSEVETAPPPGPSPISRTHTYPSGWNLVSVPLTPEDPSLNAVYGDDLSSVAGWRWDSCNGQYVVPEAKPGNGFWLLIPGSGATVGIEGTAVTNDISLDLTCSGWHQVSAPWDYSVDKILFVEDQNNKTWDDAVAAGWIADAVWRYDASARKYEAAANLSLWEGYWIKTLVPNLTMKLLVADAQTTTSNAPSPPETHARGSMPPPPPAEASSASNLVVLNTPNPITNENATTFRVLGTCPCNIHGLRVKVFDLSGQLIWAGESSGSELRWQVQDSQGNCLANGVYLYEAEVMLGDKWITLKLNKLIVLR